MELHQELLEAEKEELVPTVPGAVTANRKAMTTDLLEITTLARGKRKDIEGFINQWNKERGVKEGKIVAQFLVGLLNRLA